MCVIVYTRVHLSLLITIHFKTSILNDSLNDILLSIRSSVGRRISFNYISLLLIQFTNLILPIVTYPYLIKVVGTKNFGLIIFAQSICLVLYVLVDYGFGLSATRRISRERADKRKMSKTFSTVLVIKLSIAVVLFLLYLVACHIVPKLKEEQSIFLLSYLVVIGQAMFPDWFFQGIEKMKIMAFISLIAKLIFTVLIFVLITNKGDYVVVPLLQGLGYIFAGFLSLFLAKNFLYVVKPCYQLGKELLRESFSLFVSNLAARIINTVPVLFLGILAGDLYVGVYSSIEKLISTTKGVFVSLYQALYPWLVNQNHQKQRSYVKKMIFVVSFLAIITIVPFLIFGKTLLNLLYNDPDIISYGYLIHIMAFNLLSAAIYMLFVMHYFPAVGKFIVRLKIISIVAILSLFIAYFLISQEGLLGATFTSVVIEILLALFSIYFFVREKTDFDKARLIVKSNSLE